MGFAEEVAELAARSEHAARLALTEEATKTAVILPLLQALGFDVFNLDEVVPEYVADIGIKKGEKIDFAVKIDGKVAILIEAKPINMALGSVQYSQLYRYFAVSEARLAMLTNGREIWFFSDIDERNRLDKRPFFVFDLQQHDKAQVEELARFRKQSFAIDSILEVASKLNRVKAAATYLKRQLEQPDDDFVRLIGKSFHEGSFTKSVIEELRPAIQSALDSVIRDRIQDRLGVAFADEGPKDPPPTDEAESAPAADIVTTDDERLSFRIVQAIAAKTVAPQRVTLRDAKSYCAIIFDNNNRKPICRLFYGEKTRSVAFFDAQKVETRIQISAVEDLYGHEDRIRAVVESYL